jgi:HSP20 family molecular chaperone IbpA
MASTQELQVQKKREAEKKEETTIPERVFLPNADIYETQDALTVILPGVEKNNIEVKSGGGVLSVLGQLDLSKGSNPSTRNIISATMPGIFSFPARSIKTRSPPS